MNLGWLTSTGAGWLFLLFVTSVVIAVVVFTIWLVVHQFGTDEQVHDELSQNKCETCGADWSHFDETNVEAQPPCFCDLLPANWNWPTRTTT